MSTKVFVANLNYSTVGESELFQLLNDVCDVVGAKVIRNPVDVGSRGFGFVELASESELDLALQLDGFQFRHRTLRVEPAKEK
jgi:RNA recognition motif-containing protein